MVRAQKRKERVGSVTQKVLLLLATGVSLALTQNPSRYFRIIQSSTKEWGKINQRSLHDAIKKLYLSKMINYTENNDGTISLTLADDGEKYVLQYNVNNIQINKPEKWDNFWRIALFDIPEHKKQARNALSFKLKTIGMLPMQKSVFVSPYDCKKEVDFISEIFEVKPYVRFILAKDIDIALDLKQRFNIS